jgi:hypothetical protein
MHLSGNSAGFAERPSMALIVLTVRAKRDADAARGTGGVAEMKQWSGSMMKLPMVIAFVGGVVGCASAPEVPAGVPVHALVAERLTFQGTAQPTLKNSACTAAAPGKPDHLMHLESDTRATILLGPVPGEAPLPVAMLHITNLETNKTWCVMTSADGTPAALGAELPGGMYAISVAETNGAPARRYEVKVSKL